MAVAKAGGIIQNVNLAQISILGVPDRPGIAKTIFNALFQKGVNVQFIAQVIELENTSHIVLCISNDDLEAAKSAVEEANKDVGAQKILYYPNVAMVSVFGPHFRDHPGIAGLVFSALASVGINILAISTSISSISCVIDSNLLDSATNALKEAFNLPASSIYVASNGLSLRKGS